MVEYFKKKGFHVVVNSRKRISGVKSVQSVIKGGM